MPEQLIVIQASSVSWAGGGDLCMTLCDGEPVVKHTVARVLQHFPDASVVIAAPAFDREGALNAVAGSFPGRVDIFYGHDASPLNRLLDVSKDLADEDYLLRIDGLHLFFDPEASRQMLKIARSEKLDCVKFPDDFPVQFSSDVYRVGALRLADQLLDSPELDKFRIHPKFFMFMRKDRFKTRYFEEAPRYSDELLRRCREIDRTLGHAHRLEFNEKRRIKAGDQLGFHYDLALEHFNPSMKVLDVACGEGWGTRMLSTKVQEAHGADLDEESIAIARGKSSQPNTRFHVQDVTKMTFADGEFDAVATMETIEHVDGKACLREIHRVLKPGGLMVLSTPQNRLGHIPVNSAHVHEYSLEELLGLGQQFFQVERVIAIKTGQIHIPGDNYGNNQVLVCRKRAH